MKLCRARQNGTQDQRPVLKPKKEVPHYIQAAGVVIQRKKVLLAQRPSKGLLGGMWEFPNGRVDGDPAQGLPKALKTTYKLRLRVKRNHRAERSEPLSERSRHWHPLAPDARTGVAPVQVSAHSLDALGIVQHAYTHFKVTVHVFLCELTSMPEGTNLKWVALKDLDQYPMGKIDRQIANMIVK
jgi:A/G-specific adenine glycosylase